MAKNSLVWDEWNKNHIKKHNVTIKEIEEVYRSRVVEENSYSDRKLILGKTKQDRLLTVIIAFTKQKELYVVSARDMSKKERRIYEHQTTKTN